MGFLERLLGKTGGAAGPAPVPQAAGTATTKLQIDKHSTFDIEAKDLRVLAVYSSDPYGFMSFLEVNEHMTAVLNLFDYADSGFTDKLLPFIKSGVCSCATFLDTLAPMAIQEAYSRIRADLSAKNVLGDGDSMILLNTGFVSPSNIGSFMMIIGVMVVADGKATGDVVSADRIQNGKVKFGIG
jgi:hypothetical protein